MESTPMCDWDAGERAMIIKGDGGADWAIVIGRWTGLRQGVTGRLSFKGIPGSPGELSLRLHCPINSKAQHFKLPYSQKKYTIDVGSVHVDLQNGTINVSSLLT